MWPFKGFKSGGVVKTAKPASDEISPHQALANEMHAWRKVGETFTYLGRECVVTGYARYLPSPFGTDVVNELQADYADDLGVIRSVTFTPHEWRALADKQPNTQVQP